MAGPLLTTPAPGRPPTPRGVGILVWAAMVAFLLLFLAVVKAVEPPADDPEASRQLLFGLALATSAAGIAFSWLVPPRIHARHTGGRPGANAFVRSLVGWGACEAAALYPLVAHVLVHDHRLLGVFAVDLVALLALYPTRNAWAQLAADRVGGRAGGAVR